MSRKQGQLGFTLVEIAIVLLIVGILLGYTVALFPKQQDLKKYRAVEVEMDRVIEAIIGFAQVNGRLPCPAIPNSNGNEDGGGGVDCNNYGGFVPVNTLGLTGKLNQDTLLLDPWGNPYRYYVTNNDANGAGGSDFVRNGQMRTVGLVDVLPGPPDGYIDLDGRYLICDDNGTTTDDECTGANQVFGNANGVGAYAGAPFVLLSQGKNWNAVVPVNDELENIGSVLTTTNLGMVLGPSGNEYLLKDVGVGQTTFVRRPTGFADDFDDVVRWASPHVLYSKMIEAGQLP
ncbi:MAG: type II secretion system GspH family protein [Gammaproteobacteria bacterium]|nr:type II secretion system GspH family protein [Gammaproteobacteria bacterium]MDH3858859.1 type II secretion system GspH family protein [Gammaproteobacteria bacterium]